MSLKAKVLALADAFANGVLEAVRNASLEDILNEGRGMSAPRSATPTRTRTARRRRGRLARRSPEQPEKIVVAILAELRKEKDGLRSEELQKRLSLDKNEITGPLTAALGAKKIRKTGQRRATKYLLA